jgi:hypothetical protein
LYIFPYVAQIFFNLDAVKKFVFPRIAQIGINYRSSPLSRTEGSFTVKAGDRMPYFEVDGVSVYDHLRNPRFHLVLFTSEDVKLETDIPEQWSSSIDTTNIEYNSEIQEIFGSAGPFFLILRPDNYIGLISADLTSEKVIGYLKSFA